MKKQVRILAALLALLTVLAVFPVGVFASTWLDIQGTTTSDEEAGTSSSVITVTVDGDALLSAVKGGGLSGIRSGIALADLTDVIPVEELLEWFPQESLTELVQDIIDDIGTERLLTYLDPVKLFAAVDTAELVNLIKDIDNIETYVKDFDQLMSYVSSDRLLDAISCVDLDKLIHDHVTELIDLALGASGAMSNSELLEAIDVERLIGDKIISLDAIVDVDAVQDVFDELSDETVNFLLSDACTYINVDKIVASISSDKLLSITDYYVGEGRYWNISGMLDDNIITVSAVISGKLVNIDTLLADAEAALDLDALVNTDFIAGKPVSELKAFVKLPEVTALLKSKGYDTLKQYFAESALTTLISGKNYSQLSAYLNSANYGKLLDEAGMTYARLQQYFDNSKLENLMSASGFDYAALSPFIRQANLNALLGSIDSDDLEAFVHSENLGDLLDSLSYDGLKNFLHTANLNTLLGSLNYNQLKDFLRIGALASYIKANFDYATLQAYADISVIAGLVAATDYTTLQTYVNQSRIIEMVQAKDSATVANYVSDFGAAITIISEETGTPIPTIAATCSSAADLASNGYLTPAVVTRMINENVISLDDVIFGSPALLPLTELFADATAVNKDLALFGGVGVEPLVSIETILNTEGAADINAIIFGKPAASIPQLVSLKELFDENIVDFHGMIFGDGVHTGIVTLDMLTDSGVINLPELVFGIGGETPIAPIITLDDLIDAGVVVLSELVFGIGGETPVAPIVSLDDLMNAGVVDLSELIFGIGGETPVAPVFGIDDLIDADVVNPATILFGDSAKGLDPLVTIGRLIELDIINLQLAVNGNGSTIPTLFTTAELESLIDVTQMLTDHVLTVSELLSSGSILAEDLATAYGYEALLNMTAVRAKFETLSPAILTRHLDVTKTLQYFKDNGHTVSDLMKYLVGGSWDLKRLLASDLISLSALIGFDNTAAVNVAALLEDKVHFGSLKLTDVIDITELKRQLNNLPDKSALIGCVNTKRTVEIIGLSRVVGTLGGYATLINNYVIDLPGMFTIIGLESILSQIISEGKINVLFDLNGLINAIGVENLLKLVDINEIFKQLKESGALNEIISSLDLKKYVKYLVRLINNAEKKIESVSIGELLIAYKDDDNLLAFSAKNLVQALTDLIPKWSDIAAYRNGDTVFEVTLHLTYKDNEDPSKILTKDITLRVVIADGAERIASIAQRAKNFLDRYLTYSYTASSLTFDLRLPEKVSSGYARVLAHLAESVPTLADKLVIAYDSTGNQLVSLADSITVGEISDLLDSIDTARFTQAYSRVVGQQYVQILLSYVHSATGFDVEHLTLDDLVVRSSADLPTLHDLCEKIREKTGFDVESRLPISSQYTNATPVELLRLLAERVGKEFDLQPILESAAKDADPFDYFYRAVAQKIDESGEVFDAIKARVLSYVNRALSTSIGYKLKNVALSDFYRGNGVFTFSGDAAFRPKTLIDKAMNKLLPQIREKLGTDAEDIVNTLLSYLSDEELTFTVNGTIHATNFYKASFYGTDGTLLRTAIVPVGQKLTDVCAFPEGTGAWNDKDDSSITYKTMPAKDLSVVATVVEVEPDWTEGVGIPEEIKDITVVEKDGDTYTATVSGTIPDTLPLSFTDDFLENVKPGEKFVLTDGSFTLSLSDLLMKEMATLTDGGSVNFVLNKTVDPISDAHSYVIYLDKIEGGVVTKVESFTFDDPNGIELTFVFPNAIPTGGTDARTSVFFNDAAVTGATVGSGSVTFRVGALGRVVIVNEYRIAVGTQYLVLNPITGVETPVAGSAVAYDTIDGWYRRGTLVTISHSTVKAGYFWVRTDARGKNSGNAITVSGEAIVMVGEPVILTPVIESEFFRDVTLEGGTLGDDYSISIDDAAVSVTVATLGGTARVNIPNSQLAKLVSNGQKLVVASGNGRLKITIDNAALAAVLAQAAGRSVSISYRKLDSGDYYGTESGAWYYDLTILYDGVAEPTSFAGNDVEVTLPFDDVLTASADSKTVVSTKNATDDLEDFAVVADTTAKTVTFGAPHFTVYGVVNKYFVSWNEKILVDEEGKASAEESLTEVLPINPMTGGTECIVEGFYEAGHLFPLTGAQMGFDATLAYRWLGFSDGTKTYTATDANFKMPAATTTLTHRVERIVYHVFYFVNGALTDTVSYTYAERNDDRVKVLPALPEGYDAWAGFDAAALGTTDVYVAAHPTEITTDTVYTFVFVDADGKKIAEFSTTKADFASQTIPEVPAKAGFIGSWATEKGVPFDTLLTYVWNNDTVLYTLVATYEEDVVCPISAEGVTIEPANAHAGDTVTVTVPTVEGKTASTVTVRSWADGSEQILPIDANGQVTFVMPAGGVSIIVNYRSVPGIGTFSYTIKRGYKLVKSIEDLPGAPTGLVRTDARITEDGDLILTYRYTQTEGEDIEAFIESIRTEPMTVEEQYLIDGKLYGAEADAEGYLKDVSAAVNEWLLLSGTGYKVPAMSFEDKSDNSVCWIICAAVLLFLMLIVLIYVLYITGKLGANFITKFATFIVSIFFAICVGIYLAGAKIASFFGFSSKKGK